MLLPASIVEKLHVQGFYKVLKSSRDTSTELTKRFMTVASIMIPGLEAPSADVLLAKCVGILTLLLWLAFSHFGLTKVIGSQAQRSNPLKASEEWMRVIRVDIVGLGPRFLLLFVGIVEIVLAQLLLTQYRNIGMYGLLFVMMNAVIVCHALGKPKLKAFMYFNFVALLLIMSRNVGPQHMIGLELKSLTILFGAQ